MKFYFAPMEGITGYIYRRAHAQFFNNTDKYFLPFIAANQHGRFSSREMQDVLPEHNEGMIAIPQILTNNAEDFIRTSKQLKALGYDEINLNLGCPSGTVVAKNKGAGFLAQKEALDRFLEEVFDQSPTRISVKTRIGKENPEEFYDLIRMYNQYPMEELIIHPRVQKDYYKNKPNMKIFEEGLNESTNPVCYNGDIFTVNHYKDFIKVYPNVKRIMLGRGMLANPGLIQEIQSGEFLEKERLKVFHDKLYVDYQAILSGERNVLFKMKEAWFYMIYMFSNSDKYAKKIKKAQRLSDYEQAVEALFREQDLIKGAGMFCSRATE